MMRTGTLITLKKDKYAATYHWSSNPILRMSTPHWARGLFRGLRSYTQCAEWTLNKIVKAINKTFAGLKCMLQDQNIFCMKS